MRFIGTANTRTNKKELGELKHITKYQIQVLSCTSSKLEASSCHFYYARKQYL
ncbi:hypothetical protein C0J52_23838 [Blattella germanica]|nr:hypothetical protein C0J52_23838 [Blattella germanica]